MTKERKMMDWMGTEHGKDFLFSGSNLEKLEL